jgi:predicted flap endonuclease-1-like 5' DNA nuclease
MFDNLNPLTRKTAILEMLIMLIGSFVLGYLFHWLFHHQEEKETRIKTVPLVRSTPKMEAPATTLKASAKDDLKIVEGIGPKIEMLLNDAGIMTYASLASAPVSKLQDVLTKAGNNFKVHDPSSWPEQATLARDGEFDALEELKSELTGGRI